MNQLDNHPAKVRSSNSNLNRWKSWDANTPFAPNFDISIYTDIYNQYLCTELAKILESRNERSYEKVWETYNIFSWNFDEMKYLAKLIYQTYSSYMTAMGEEPLARDKVWIRGWAVALEAGQKIDIHCHNITENAYLSGNVSLSNLGSTTDYWFPYLSTYFGWWKSVNTVGSMNMFPAWLEHRVDTQQSNTTRYSIAFDLFTEHTLDFISKNRNFGSVPQTGLLTAKTFESI